MTSELMTAINDELDPLAKTVLSHTWRRRLERRSWKPLMSLNFNLWANCSFNAQLCRCTAHLFVATAAGHVTNKLTCDLPENVASSDHLCPALPAVTIGLKYALQVLACLFLELPTAATNTHIMSPHIGSVGICVLGKCQ